VVLVGEGRSQQVERQVVLLVESELGYERDEKDGMGSSQGSDRNYHSKCMAGEQVWRRKRQREAVSGR